MINATNLFLLANILYCLSYLMRDMLWLRAFALLAAVSTFPYFYFRPTPMYWAIFWQVAFLVINLGHALVLIRERLPVKMPEELGRLRALAFRTLRPRELELLTQTGEWKTAGPGDVLIRKGEIGRQILLVFHGVLKVEKDGRVVAHLRDGQFAGAASFLSGKPHGADIVAVEPTRYLVWEWSMLQELWRHHPGIQDIFASNIGLDVAAKLETSRG